MKFLAFILILSLSVLAQKGTVLAVPIDSSIIIKDTKPIAATDTKVAAHIDSCLWQAKMVRWLEPAKVIRPQEDIWLKSILGTKDTTSVRIMAMRGKDTLFYRCVKVGENPIDSCNATFLRILFQFEDKQYRTRDSTGALK